MQKKRKCAVVSSAIAAAVIASVGSQAHANTEIISLTAAPPTTYGSDDGTISITGGNGKYVGGSVALHTPYTGGYYTDVGLTTGYVAISTFSPASDKEIYALKLDSNGSPLGAFSSTAALIVADINASESTGVAASPVNGSPYSALFPGYEVLLTLSPGIGSTAYLGFDFSSATDSDDSFYSATVTGIAAIPEPASLGLVVAAPLMLLRRRKRVLTTIPMLGT